MNSNFFILWMLICMNFSELIGQNPYEHSHQTVSHGPTCIKKLPNPHPPREYLVRPCTWSTLQFVFLHFFFKRIFGYCVLLSFSLEIFFIHSSASMQRITMELDLIREKIKKITKQFSYLVWYINEVYIWFN